MYSDVENAINVFNEDGSYKKLGCVNNGLYYINLDASDGSVDYLTTVSEQKHHSSNIKIINSKRKKKGVHPVMLSSHIIKGKQFVLLSYSSGSFVYAVKGGTSNSCNKIRAFDALYLKSNNERVGHFVNNIDTMQRNSLWRGIKINKKSIPMNNLMIDLQNSQPRKKPASVKFTKIDKHTTVNDYKEYSSNSGSDFECDDKSYATCNNSTLN